MTTVAKENYTPGIADYKIRTYLQETPQNNFETYTTNYPEAPGFKFKTKT